VTLRDIDAFANAMLGGRPMIETIPEAELAPSRIQGLGLFAKRDLRAGDVICTLDGQVVDVSHYPAVIDALEWNALTPELLLVRPLRTSYGFINHSSRPNLSIDDDGRTLRACLAVARGDEFTLNYFAHPVPPAYLAGEEAAVLRRAG
jgi:hypothetical protein